MSDKVQHFMESPLVAWAKTFDDYNTVKTTEDLADGILLNKIMHTVDPTAYPMSKVDRSVARDPALRMQNLQLLISRIKHFYLTTLQQLVITTLPNISVISHNPEKDYSMDEMEKLLVLLLGCVVQCEGKVPLIERMKVMDLTQQQALVVHIQTMTDTTDYVCSIDWNDLEEISKPNLEGLCRTAYLHLQRVAKERDRHYDTLSEVVLERDYYKQIQSQNANDSLPHDNGLSLVTTPIKSPSLNPDVLELKKKCRQLQEQLDRKSEMVTDLKEDVEQARSTIHRLQQEKRDLLEDAKSVRIYRDEIETLKVQCAKIEKLEADVMKYRQKAEDTEYLKKRIADLKQQNELMLETKALLEQKAVSLTSRAESVDELQEELASLRVQLDSLNQEKDMDMERMEELLSTNAQMELDVTSFQEQIVQLQSELEMERASEVSTGSGEASNLSFEMTEADLASKAKVLRLEKEARDMERTAEALRHSQAKVAELEKTNKKLYAQTHTDRKEIIKLREEVEVLKVKASRVDKLQVELNSQRERLEEASRLQARLKDLKGKNEVLLEAKAKLEDEVDSFQSKASMLEDIKDENASLKVQVESLTSTRDEDQKRIQELLEQNAQLELMKQKGVEDRAGLHAELEQERSRNGPQAPVTMLSPPRITEAEMASRAKLQRLEKETREMEKTMEALRHSQAKNAELERTNKKLQEQTHTHRKEVVRLKEELQALKTKSHRMDKLEFEMKTQEQKLEDIDAARKKIAELKQQNALFSETKILLQEEISSLHAKLEKLNDLQGENAALKVRVDSLEQESQEEGLRMQELLQLNAQLELDREKMSAELEGMNSEVAFLKLKLVEPTEVPFSPAGPPMSEMDFSIHTKMLRLDRDKRELERNFEVLKKSTERVTAERENMMRKLTSQNHAAQKELAKLKEELKRAHGSQLTRFRSVSVDTEQETKLESKFKEAYSQSLATKDERIQVLETRVEEMTNDSSQLREEISSLRKQNEKLAQLAKKPSPGGSPTMGDRVARTYSTHEMSRLKEQAAEAVRLRDKAHHLQEENSHLSHDLLQMKRLTERQSGTINRLGDRMHMLEQLHQTLEEEKRTLLLQLTRTLEQNQDMLVKTLESKDQAIEEERSFNDRLGELARDKERLSRQLIAQQREHLAREMDYLKKSKSKNLLKRGFKKLKGKIQGRTHTFELPDTAGAGLGLPTSQQSLTSSVNLNASSQPTDLWLPPYSMHEGSMSSSLSISSSNSERHYSDGQEDFDQELGGPALIPRAPTMDGSPFLRPRKSRSYTMPSVKFTKHTHASSSPSVEAELADDLMSLEDFLAENDKTPNRRRVMELKRASLILNTPPVTPRNSMLLSSQVSSNSTGNMFDLQEFLSKFEPEEARLSIPELEETEPEQKQPAMEFLGSQQSHESNTSLHSDHPPVEINIEGNGNSNNNNSTSGPLEATSSTLSDGISPGSWTSNSGSATTISWGTTSEISITSSRSVNSGEKRRLRAVKSTGEGKRPSHGSSSVLQLPVLRGWGRQRKGLPKSRSSEMLKEAGKGKGKSKLKKKSAHRSSEDLLAVEDKEMVTGKPPLVRKKVHKSAADMRDHRQKNERSYSESGGTSLSGLTDLSRKGETKIQVGKKNKNPKRLSLPSWGSKPADSTLAPPQPEHVHSRESLQSPKSDDDSFWLEYGCV